MVRWPIVILGSILTAVGTWFERMRDSAWMQANIPSVVAFFDSIHALAVALVVGGVVVLVFGLAWNRWVLASILGAAAAVAIVTISYL